MRGIRVRSLGGEDPLEKEMATHSSTLAWKILWTKEPGRLGYSPCGHREADTTERLHFTSLHFRVQMPGSFMYQRCGEVRKQSKKSIYSCKYF